MKQIDQALIEAYNRADYRVASGFAVKIGEKSAALSNWYAATGAKSFCFITAHNPASVILSEADNEKAHKALGHALRALANEVVEAEGSDPAGEWPAEAGYAALGLTREQAIALGQEFGQNAIVWAGPDGLPRLEFCAP